MFTSTNFKNLFLSTLVACFLSCGGGGGNNINPEGFPDVSSIPNEAPTQSLFDEWKCQATLKSIQCDNSQIESSFNTEEITQFNDFLNIKKSDDGCYTLPYGPTASGNESTCNVGGNLVGIETRDSYSDVCVDMDQLMSSVLTLDNTNSMLTGTLGIDSKIRGNCEDYFIKAECMALYDLECTPAPELSYPSTQVSGNINDDLYGTWSCYTDFIPSTTCSIVNSQALRDLENDYSLLEGGYQQSYTITPKQGRECIAQLEDSFLEIPSEVVPAFYDIFAVGNNDVSCSAGNQAIVIQSDNYPYNDFQCKPETRFVSRFNLTNNQQLQGDTLWWFSSENCPLDPEYGDLRYECSVALSTNCQKTENYQLPSDIDRDGIPNEIDNCPNTSNLDQRDSNFNGVGDACEVDLDYLRNSLRARNDRLLQNIKEDLKKFH